jgi:ribonuclease III
MVKNYNYNIKEPIVIPYNKKNKLIKDVNVKTILKKLNINVDITDIELYRKSLTHKSYIKKEYYTNHKNDLENAKKKLPDNILDLRDQSNERLEFLGDTIIKAVVSHYLFERYPKEDEGFMTRLKTKIENQKSLARFARKIGIDEFIIISSQNEFGNIGRTNDKILEDAFESFLGALYLDCGFLVCKRFMRYILENYIDYSDLLYNDDNFKDQLLRVYHSFKWEHPKYTVINQEGPPHKRVFTIGVYDNENRIVGKANDTSKKRAEQKASKMALYYYKKLNNDQLNDNIYNLI